MKTHLNLGTRDLDAAVAFYGTLLGAAPATRHADYALFVTADPGLELALALDGEATAPRGHHFGLAVESVDAVDAQIARLTAAGYATEIERDETCCYAKQTKVWTADPEGRRWETYAVLEETAERDTPGTTCCRSDAAAASGATCCA